MIVAGVDDAGRGSLLGPLVIAGVSFEDSEIEELRRIGVRDSKLLSSAKRRKLFRKIKEIAIGVSVWRINPQRIDNVVFNGQRLHKLNYLEARYMALALSHLVFDVAYVDCCDVREARFGELVSELLCGLRSKNEASIPFHRMGNGENIARIKSEHHADRNYPVVSAASIIAKVTRDVCISKIQKTHGLLGSGYPSDSVTLDYMRGFIERSEKLPGFTRLSWDTIKRLEEEAEARTLEEFI